MGFSRGTPARPVWQLWPAAARGCSSEHRPPAVAERICQLIAEAYVGRGHAPVVVCACRAPLPGAQLGLGGHGGAWAVGGRASAVDVVGGHAARLERVLCHLRRQRPYGGGWSWGSPRQPGRRGRDARQVAFAAGAATGWSCDASRRGPRSRRADHRCRLVRCGSGDHDTRVGTSPSWAGAVGLHTNSPQVASLTALVRRLERARPAPALELLGCSFLFERLAGFLAAGFAG